MSHRPMPGPPEDWWYCTPPHGEPGLCTSDMDPAEYMPFTHLKRKRLTDAECAAEYWRAYADALRSHPATESWSARPIDTICREHIWHRFVTRPHALEEA